REDLPSSRPVEQAGGDEHRDLAERVVWDLVVAGPPRSFSPVVARGIARRIGGWLLRGADAAPATRRRRAVRAVAVARLLLGHARSPLRVRLMTSSYSRRSIHRRPIVIARHASS